MLQGCCNVIVFSNIPTFFVKNIVIFDFVHITLLYDKLQPPLTHYALIIIIIVITVIIIMHSDLCSNSQNLTKFLSKSAASVDLLSSRAYFYGFVICTSYIVQKMKQQTKI